MTSDRQETQTPKPAYSEEIREALEAHDRQLAHQAGLLTHYRNLRGYALGGGNEALRELENALADQPPGHLRAILAQRRREIEASVAAIENDEGGLA